MNERKLTGAVPVAAAAIAAIASLGAAFILYWCAISIAERELALRFSLIWPVAGAVLIASAANARRVGSFFARPFFRRRAVRVPLAAFAALFLAISLVFFARVVSFPRPVSGGAASSVSRSATDGSAPAYAIVLGGGVHRDGRVSTTLAMRLETAAAFARENPDARLVVTGGLLPPQPLAEADAMAEWLAGNEGIDGSRIIREREALDTIQNFKYSLALIGTAAEADVAASGQAPVVATVPAIAVVTSDFHMNRSLFLARRAGFGTVVPLPSPSPALMAPNNYLRETGAWWKLSIRLALAGEWSAVAGLISGR